MAGDWDILLAAGLAVAGALAFLTLPAGSFLRVALAFLALFIAPGYLLIEASAGPARDARRRAARLLLAIGLSPPLVGLAALATAIAPGGFRASSIVLFLTVVALALAGVAFVRRHRPAKTTDAPGPLSPDA